ncbi:MAG: hypothetical protein LPJ91_02090 [Pseudazoarcus pumilus]|nr:hypothetical protein [Pseudazoarcus pumilus]
MDVGKLFDNVTALAGVEGAWLLDADGVAHVHRRPPGLAQDPLENARAHIRALYAAIDSGPAGADDCVLRYDQRCLLLRRAGPFVLAVLTQDASSLVAVRMVTNLLVRNLTPEAVGALKPQPDPGPAEAPPAVEESAPLAPAKGVRMYRGQPY